MNVFTLLIRYGWIVGLILGSGQTWLAISAPGIYAGWGATNLVTTNSPVGVGLVTQISAGGYHAVALRVDRTVVAWGDGGFGQTNVPVTLSNVVAISAGTRHSLALSADGSVVAWGYNQFGQTNVPAGLSEVIAVSAGADHSVALRSNGTVMAWGNSLALTNVPASATNIVAIAAGSTATLALRADGTVLAWGANTYAITNLPAGLTNVAGITIGLNHCLAVRSNGSVLAWGGDNAYGQNNVPTTLTNAVAVSAGWLHSLAMRADGTLVAWGLATSGQTNIPASLTNVSSFSAGNTLNLAVDLAPRLVVKPPGTVTLSPGQSHTLSVTALSGSAATFQWFFNGDLQFSETNADFIVTDFSTAKAGIYSILVSNVLGYSASAATTVRMTNAPTVQVNGVPIGGGGATRTNSATITLTAATNTYAKLYYTLDGSEPNFTSPAYSTAFVISNSVSLRAAAYNNLFTDKSEAASVAIQVIPTYPLTIFAPGGNIAVTPTANINPTHYLSNTLVTLTATPISGWSFLYWTGAVSSTDSLISVLLDQPRSLQAVFGTTLNLFTNGYGHLVTDPASGPFPYGSTVTLAALPQVTNYFFGWAGIVSGSNNPITLVATNASGLTALFGALKSNQISLVVLPVGGGGVQVSPAQNAYTMGDLVTLTAVNSSNRIFSHWSGDAAGLSNPLVLTLDANKLIRANFVPGTPTDLLPVFTYSPGGRSLSPGSDTTLSAAATGIGVIHYQWRLNGANLTGAVGAQLALTNLTPAKAGLYDVLASNAYGMATSPAAPVALFGLQLSPAVNSLLPLLIVDCAPGAQFQLEYASDLQSTNWSLLAPLSLPAARYYFIDEPASGRLRRFYRLVPQ